MWTANTTSSLFINSKTQTFPGSNLHSFANWLQPPESFVGIAPVSSTRHDLFPNSNITTCCFSKYSLINATGRRCMHQIILFHHLYIFLTINKTITNTSFITKSYRSQISLPICLYLEHEKGIFGCEILGFLYSSSCEMTWQQNHMILVWTLHGIEISCKVILINN